MPEFLRGLLDSEFMPHGHCYLWRNDLVWLHAGSDSLVALSYFLIPFGLFYFVRKRSDLAFNWMFLMFAAFIFACGTTHLLEVWSIWHGTYWFTGFVKLFTGVISFATAIMLYPLIPKALAIPSPAQLREANARLSSEVEERLRAQNELRKMNEELESRVQTRTAELATANESLRLEMIERERAEQDRRKLETKILQTQKMESLGVLAGGIAHDFNNLLTGILGNADLALLDLPPESSARARLRDIETSAIRAAELTKQMLAYSGKGQFVIEPIHLSKLVEEMAHLLKTVISKKAVLRFRFADQLPLILADATQIRQIVMNLLTNASEAIGDKSGVITISTGKMDLDQEYLSRTFFDEGLKEGQYVYLEVSDTGCGMDEETMRRIFDPFFTTKFAGRGLGLAAVLGIVRGHRGAVKVYSHPGEGTTFKILLPADSDAEAYKQRAEQSSRDQWHGDGTVLIIDDEAQVRKVGRMMLERMGFKVVESAGGRDALDYYRDHAGEVRLVLLDMTMPEMSGPEVFRELRRIRPDTRVVLCSGYSEQEATNRFEGKGLAGFLQKPFRTDELRTKVRDAIESAEPDNSGDGGKKA